jgi:transposase
MVEPIFKRSAGLDVHKKMVMATILVEQPDGHLQEETREFKTFPKDLRALAQWLQQEAIELTVMESTGVFWKSVFAALEACSLKVFVVNAQHVKQVPGRKTDVKDSQWLAALARFGLLKGSFIPEQDLRELRVVTRYRTKLTGTLAGEKNRLHKVLDDAGIHLGNVVTDINGTSAHKMIQGLILGEPIHELVKGIHRSFNKKMPELKEVLSGTLSQRHRFVLEQIHLHILHLENELQNLDDYILNAMEPYRTHWQILQTVPGIDAIGAAMIIVEIGVDMQRFGNREALCSWAGLCPGNNESAGKKKSSKTRKGNHQLRVLLCQSANAAVKTRSQFKGKYQGLLIRKGHKKAIIAVGHKILRVIHSVLKNGKPYQDPEIDYEALVTAKNAPRWIKALDKFGYLPTVAA